jgi:hypothetical protein
MAHDWFAVCRVAKNWRRIGALEQAIAWMEKYARTKAKPLPYALLSMWYTDTTKKNDAYEQGEV